MMRFSALVLGGAIGVATLLQSGTADAGRARFSGGVRFSSRVHVRGPGVSVRFHRPFWRPRVWGSVWVGGYYYPRPYYYYYYPESVPSYYGGGGYYGNSDGNSYYPVQPNANAAPGLVQAGPPPRPPMPSFGIGVAAGGSNVQDRQDSTDLSVLARLRLTPGLLIEGEFGKTEFKDNLRVDRRIGGSLIWEIGARNNWAPYLLAGAGVQQADVNGDFQSTLQFGEIGVGLRWALSRNLHLTADIRAGARKTIDSNEPVFLTDTVRAVAPPSVDAPNAREDYTRGRLAAILYF